MKIFKFFEALKLARKVLGLTQAQVADIISKPRTGSVCDTSTISRWEGGGVVPPHKKQIEIFTELNLDFEYLKGSRFFNIDGEALERYFKQSLFENCHWDFACDEGDDYFISNDTTVKTSVKSDRQKLEYSIYYEDSGNLLGKLDYDLKEREELFSQSILTINSIYCTRKSILLDMVAFLIANLTSREVENIVYFSSNKLSPICRLLKSIGFQPHKHGTEGYCFMLDYHTMLYNQSLFYLSLVDKDRFQ
ncbi:hypothetical protein MACH09_12840 [Vibrio sp. MACH09]|uniref:helix-turn-helix domain-containing protein n=1 Tax=Vibrio sp. MACH09 TaxID=3025122 RepID=UPI00278F7651|nr:helix-turn-helix transcriptional regulator [Vibrio sp. MACH09]GLO60776.1 hypothetical protein MACH09_12840 [Vibrio sp. MACH09]